VGLEDGEGAQERRYGNNSNTNRTVMSGAHKLVELSFEEGFLICFEVINARLPWW
jgi:hypothetical protein